MNGEGNCDTTGGTIFFLASGNRHFTMSIPQYVGKFGYYWAATPGENLSPGISQEECAYGYNFDNQHSQTSYLQYRHTVLSVRCVKVQ